MRTLGLASLLLSVLLIPACGNFTFRGAINTNAQTVNGLVSVVNLTFINGDVQVTIVTLQNSFGGSNFTFCGDQTSQFPMNNQVRATFTSAQPCSNLLTVVIVIN